MKIVPAAKNHPRLLFLLAAVLSLLASCTVKNYPVNRPFVYETKIKIEGKFKGDEEKVLDEQLAQQLHDSVKVRRQRKFLFWNVLDKPPVYDSANASRSVGFMHALLHSLGYYRDSVRYEARFDSTNDEGRQLRTYLTFHVLPGTRFQLDEVVYNLTDSQPDRPEIQILQDLTVRTDSGRLLKPGEPFATGSISQELDRLTDLYRNNGFLLFGKEQLWAVWDTVGLELILPAFTPAEQARQIEALRRQRESPTADVQIRLRPNPDSNKLRRYYIGQVTVYPDLTVDTANYTPLTERLGPHQYEFISYSRKFRVRKLLPFVDLPRGSVASQAGFLRTQNRFNNIGSWQQVNVTPIPRAGTDSVDFVIRMVPDWKYYTSINADVSRNTGYLLTESSLIGIGAFFNLRNTNFLRSANQYNLNFRYGVELTNRIDSLIQTQQFTLSQTITFPRLLQPYRSIVSSRWRENARSLLSLNVAQTLRQGYFNVSTFNTSFGFETSAARNSRKQTVLQFRFPNIEYNVVDRKARLKTLIDSNQSYRYIFNDGMIFSMVANLNINGGGNKVSNLARFSFEESALLFGLLTKKVGKANVLRFARFDAEFTQTRRIGPKSSFAWRTFGGLGYSLFRKGSTDSTNYYLPFFRQYFAGGPNSMRAWTVRRLGPGSSIRSFADTVAPDRFGDVRLEANLEYRFLITQLFGFPLEGALFTDIGNVWFLRDNPDFNGGARYNFDPKADQFQLRKLWRDLAVGVGYGLRWDFGFLKARFDFAYKAKDPSPQEERFQNKWFYRIEPFFWQRNNEIQFQLGINYPF